MPDAHKASLYAPEAYVAPDPASIVRDYPFALVVTAGASGLFATSTPLFFETDKTLVGHLSRRNPHAAHMSSGEQVLAVFSGPDAYISASWYEARPTVPTWNYVAAHARGTLEPIDDAAGQLQVLRLTAEKLEHGSENPWTLEHAPPGRVDMLIPHIRAFRIRIEQLEGVTKLSQTQPPLDRLRVIRHLLDRGDGDSVEIARRMAQIQPADVGAP